MPFLLASVAVVVAVWISGVQLFVFPSEPMSPTQLAGDHFVAMVGVWVLTLPQRFDMVIVDVPALRTGPSEIIIG